MNPRRCAGAMIPVDASKRAQREREFFNRYTDIDSIPDELLVVSSSFDVPPEIKRLQSRLQGKIVCDYGCGYGVSSAYFALHGARVFAFDVSETNIQVARRAARINGVEGRVFLQVLQAEFMDFPDNFFDLVYGNGVLHHVDLPLAARELHRVLKPGGLAVFRDPLGENKLLEWARHCPWRSAVHRHSHDERSLLYSDIEMVRSVFPTATVRETGLLTVLRSAIPRVQLGMILVPRWPRAFQYLARVDYWILTHLPATRPLAQYVVLLLTKPGGAPQCMPGEGS